MREFLDRLEQAAELRDAERPMDPLSAQMRAMEKRMRHLTRKRAD